MLQFCLIGSRDDVSLAYFARTIKTFCKMQNSPIECHVILVEPATNLFCEPCVDVALPYAGQTLLAALAYLGYDPKNSFGNNYLAPWHWVSRFTISPQPPPPYDLVLQCSCIEFQKVSQKITHVSIDGQVVSVDFVIMAQNITSFPIGSLNKALQPTRLVRQTDSFFCENTFVCGTAASFTTNDSCALSGIFVAQYIKTFSLKVTCLYFTVVTTREQKVKEYENICGPVHQMLPRSSIFAVNLSANAIEEGFKKKDIIRLKIQKRGADQVVHPDSDYFFVDATSLSVFSNSDPMYDELRDSYQQYVRRYLDRGINPLEKQVETMVQKSENVRLSPGTNVESWIDFQDKYPDVMEDGSQAHWRCSVALVSKTATRKQEDPNINDLCVYEAHVHNGLAEGKIVSPPRGENGFGFDTRYEPIPRESNHSIGQTFAELDLDEKCLYSARADGIFSSLYWLAMHDVFDQMYNSN